MRWVADPEPREHLPADGGWSLGEMRLTVGGHVLTANTGPTSNNGSINWYLWPVIEWVTKNWTALLHEERFAWIESSITPAATATLLTLHRLIDRDDERGRSDYASAQAWRARHALRAADPGGLYPDLFCRRSGDEIELSWTARQPVHAPDGFRFSLSPGTAFLPAGAVAEPLWKLLQWTVDTAGVILDMDKRQVDRLRARMRSLKALPTHTLEAGYLHEPLLDRVIAARNASSLPDRSRRLAQLPVLDRLDDSVLMFGCVRPDLREPDVMTLMNFIHDRTEGRDSPALAKLVDTDVGAPDTAPFDEGYDLAERLLDELALPGDASWIDVRRMLEQLGVSIVERTLDDSIRGVALAGDQYAPAIMINPRSPFNKRELGRRFTLAHELCHVLYDRTHARRLAHVTGAWAPPGVEKRANAFAAMLLMPPSLLRLVLPAGPLDRTAIEETARALRVGVIALIEHLFNIRMIDPVDRERLHAQTI